LQRPVKLAEARSRLVQVIGRHSQYQYSDITNTIVATSSSSSSEQQPTATLRDLQHILAAVRREQSDSSSLNVPPATPGSPQGGGQWELWQRSTDTAVDTGNYDDDTAVQESGDRDSNVLEAQSCSNTIGVVTSSKISGATRGSFWQSALGRALQGDLPQPPLQLHHDGVHATPTTTTAAAVVIAAIAADRSSDRSEQGELQLQDVIETQSFESTATTDTAVCATDTGGTEEPEQDYINREQQDMYDAAVEQSYDAASEIVAEVKQVHNTTGNSSSMSKQRGAAAVTTSVFEVQPTVIDVGVLCAGKAYVTEVRLQSDFITVQTAYYCSTALTRIHRA
jgi:hypothetical protein